MENSSTSQITSQRETQEEAYEVAAGLEHSADSEKLNFPASGLFCEQICNMVCAQDVNNIRKNQQQALHRFEKTNEMFERFNELSSIRFEAMQGHFRQHTKLVVELKKDLETVYRRIRNLKSKLSLQYPEAFNATHKGIKTLEDELEEGQNTAPQEKNIQEFSSLGDIFANKSLEVEETGAEVSEGSTGSSTKLDDTNSQTVEVTCAVESRTCACKEQTCNICNKCLQRNINNDLEEPHKNVLLTQPGMTEQPGPSVLRETNTEQIEENLGHIVHPEFMKDTMPDYNKKSSDSSLKQLKVTDLSDLSTKQEENIVEYERENRNGMIDSKIETTQNNVSEETVVKEDTRVSAGSEENQSDIQKQDKINSGLLEDWTEIPDSVERENQHGDEKL